MLIPRNNLRKNVLILQRRMTEYRVPLFESMRRRLSEMMIDLHVGCGTPTFKEAAKRDSGFLSWSLNVPCRYWHLNQLHFVWQRIPNDIVAQQDLVIMPHENSLISNHWLLLRRRLVGPLVAFWGHGANFQLPQTNSYQERLKSWMASQVDWWFAYTSLSVQKIVAAGFPKNRITCVNNAVDEETPVNLQKKMSVSELKSPRTKLGIRGEHVGIFIGSLYREKRLDFLFTAADKLRGKLPDFEMLIIGDGPLRETIRHEVASRPWVHWVGAKHGREKVLYLSLGQVMLNPGLVGLAILDSFAMGLPMVTTDCGIHSPEIAYLESGRNGLMVSNDVKAFVDGVLSVLLNSALRDSMAAACKADSKRYSLERMVENFCLGILKAINIGRNSRT